LHPVFCQIAPHELDLGDQARLHHSLGMECVVQQTVGAAPLDEQVFVSDQSLVAQSACCLIPAKVNGFELNATSCGVKKQTKEDENLSIFVQNERSRGECWSSCVEK
jgi:hypothetical protein